MGFPLMPRLGIRAMGEGHGVGWGWGRGGVGAGQKGRGWLCVRVSLLRHEGRQRMFKGPRKYEYWGDLVTT